MKCKDCESMIFNEISNINPDSINKEITKLLQCNNCGRYKFVKESELE